MERSISSAFHLYDSMKFTLLISFTLLASLAASRAETVGATEPAAPKKHLPKVVIDGTKKTFIDSNGKPFVPCGVSYYRPDTGWPPQNWRKFDEEVVRRDFQRMRDMGLNVARIFTQLGTFYTEPGKLNEEALAKFDKLLDIADEYGIYIHPTGPSGWEGEPEWMKPLGSVASNHANEEVIKVLEDWWTMFVGRYRGRSTIWSYDIRNEPKTAWDTPQSRVKWDEWRTAQGKPKVPVPEINSLHSEVMADYQRFRESLATEWLARQSKAIKAADPEALTTVGLIQWSIPAKELQPDEHYSAFRPSLIAPYLDFISLHYYPLARGVYKYDGPEAENIHLSMFESMLRECAKATPGKPLVIGEFGWYGGGPLDPGGKPATEEEQAQWCRRMVEVSAPMVSGWINWGLYDTPEAKDVSRLTGLLTVEGREKAWGREFGPLVRSMPPPVQELPDRPDLRWDVATSDKAVGGRFQAEYLQAFLKARENPPKP